MICARPAGFRSLLDLTSGDEVTAGKTKAAQCKASSLPGCGQFSPAVNTLSCSSVATAPLLAEEVLVRRNLVEDPATSAAGRRLSRARP